MAPQRLRMDHDIQAMTLLSYKNSSPNLTSWLGSGLKNFIPFPNCKFTPICFVEGESIHGQWEGPLFVVVFGCYRYDWNQSRRDSLSQNHCVFIGNYLWCHVLCSTLLITSPRFNLVKQGWCKLVCCGCVCACVWRSRQHTHVKICLNDSIVFGLKEAGIKLVGISSYKSFTILASCKKLGCCE